MTHGLEYEVRSGLPPSQVDDLLRLYANEWWTKDRTRPDVERMLEASDLLFAIIEKESGSLAAFARVLTDRTYLALVLDVIVAPEHRGGGLGRLLVERIELTCQPEHIPFYRKWGFSENVGRSRLMRRTSDPLLADADAQQAAAAEERRGRLS